MIAETSTPTLLSQFFQVDGGVLGLTLTALGLHQLTAIWDVAHAESRTWRSAANALRDAGAGRAGP